MTATLCVTCHRPKAGLECGLCHGRVCKSCAQFLKPDRFAFLERRPATLAQEIYCGGCFDTQVAPELARYDEVMARARQVFVFLKSKGEETRLFSRSARPIKVVDCPDYDELILRLAFLAAGAGYNAIIDVDIRSEKVRNAGYQSMRWHGTAVPTRVDAEKLERDEKLRF